MRTETTTKATSSSDQPDIKAIASDGRTDLSALYGDSSLDLSRYWRFVVDNRWLLIVFAIVGAALGLIYSFVATPIYRADTLLSPVADDQRQGLEFGEFSELAAIAGLDGGSVDKEQENLALLETRQFQEKFIVDQSLMPILFEKKWDANKSGWRDSEDQPTLREAQKKFADEIFRVKVDSATNLVTLSIEWSDPPLAAQWANEYVKAANEQIRQHDIEDAQRRIKFLNSAINETNLVSVEKGIFRRIENAIHTQVLAKVRSEYAFKVLDPAIVAESDDFVRPQRFVMVFLFTILALLVAIFAAIFRDMRRSQSGSES